MYSVLIIGLGNIGMGYDLNHDPDKYILSHARAFQKHPKFKLIAGVDVDIDRRELFESHYGCPAFTTVSEALKKSKADVIVVSNPTKQHIRALQEIIEFGLPRAVLCEKPIAFDVKQADEITTIFKKRGCEFYVNYMRRSDVGVHELYERIHSENIITPVKGNVWYTNGLFNNASHFINLLEYLFGKVEKSIVLDSGKRSICSDPEPDFQLSFEKGKFNFVALPGNSFSHNVLEIIASNGRIRYENGGEKITWEAIESNKLFPGHVTLSLEKEVLPSDYRRIQWHVVDQLSVSMDGGSARICNGDDALGTLYVLDDIENQL